jgi:hypothetical protein
MSCHVCKKDWQRFSCSKAPMMNGADIFYVCHYNVHYDFPRFVKRAVKTKCLLEVNSWKVQSRLYGRQNNTNDRLSFINGPL